MPRGAPRRRVARRGDARSPHRGRFRPRRPGGRWGECESRLPFALVGDARDAFVDASASTPASGHPPSNVVSVASSALLREESLELCRGVFGDVFCRRRGPGTGAATSAPPPAPAARTIATRTSRSCLTSYASHSSPSLAMRISAQRWSWSRGETNPPREAEVERRRRLRHAVRAARRVLLSLRPARRGRGFGGLGGGGGESRTGRAFRALSRRLPRRPPPPLLRR